MSAATVRDNGQVPPVEDLELLAGGGLAVNRTICVGLVLASVLTAPSGLYAQEAPCPEREALADMIDRQAELMDAHASRYEQLAERMASCAALAPPAQEEDGTLRPGEQQRLEESLADCITHAADAYATAMAMQAIARLGTDTLCRLTGDTTCAGDPFGMLTVGTDMRERYRRTTASAIEVLTRLAASAALSEAAALTAED